MTNEMQAILDAIVSIKARKEVLGIIPTYSLSVELKRALRGLKCEITESALASLIESGEISVGNTLNDKYYEINKNYKAEEIMEHFIVQIKSFLEGKASSDPHLAERLKIESKSMEECCRFIIQEVKKKATQQWAACTDEEVYGLAMHYWDEDDVKVNGTSSCKVVTNHELTPDEKAEAEELKKRNKEKRKKTAEENKAKAKSMADDAVKRQKQEEAKKKAKKQEEEDTLFLFTDEDFV